MTGHATLAELTEVDCPATAATEADALFPWSCTHHSPSAPGVHFALGGDDGGEPPYHVWRDLDADALAWIGAARELRSRLDALASGEQAAVHPPRSCGCPWCSLTRDAVDLACKLAGAA